MREEIENCVPTGDLIVRGGSRILKNGVQKTHISSIYCCLELIKSCMIPKGDRRKVPSLNSPLLIAAVCDIASC